MLNCRDSFIQYKIWTFGIFRGIGLINTLRVQHLMLKASDPLQVLKALPTATIPRDLKISYHWPLSKYLLCPNLEYKQSNTIRVKI